MHGRTIIVALTGVALAAAPTPGRAQDGGASDAQHLVPGGLYVLFGGGATDFTKDATKNRFDSGGAWSARIGVGERFYVGAEAAYVGAALDGGAADLRMNGAEGVVRVQYPYAAGRWRVAPFAFGGLGWSHVTLEHAAPGVKDSDDVGVVPFGAGFTFGYDRLLLDARFTYRTSFDENLALAPGERPLDLARWSVGASIGYAF